MKTILALDAGTTNVKAILIDQRGKVVAQSSTPLAIQFPKDGWVEQSGTEILNAAQKAIKECLEQGKEHEVVAL